jgi:hypothetical protein
VDTGSFRNATARLPDGFKLLSLPETLIRRPERGIAAVGPGRTRR